MVSVDCMIDANAGVDLQQQRQGGHAVKHWHFDVEQDDVDVVALQRDSAIWPLPTEATTASAGSSSRIRVTKPRTTPNRPRS